jgi:hypothetical protein
VRAAVRIAEEELGSSTSALIQRYRDLSSACPDLKSWRVPHIVIMPWSFASVPVRALVDATRTGVSRVAVRTHLKWDLALLIVIPSRFSEVGAYCRLTCRRFHCRRIQAVADVPCR